jgi:2-dehydropantoate 2-reductase
MMTTVEKPAVVIVGAGAMGSMFGALLCEGGLDVTLVDVWPEQVKAIRDNGVTILGHGGNRTIPVSITSDARTIRKADVVIFLCKGTANLAAGESVRHLFDAPEPVAISFQNGLGNEDNLGSILGQRRVIAGLTSQAAVLEAPAVVRKHAEQASYIGERNGGLSNRVENIAAALSAHGLQTRASDTIMREKWEKLLINISFTATSGLTGLKLGDVIDNQGLRETASRAMEEAALVAKAEGIELDPGRRHGMFDRMKASDARNSYASALADINAGRPTEVDYIYGYPIRLAQKHGLLVPTLRTLAALMSGRERAQKPLTA